MRETRGFLALLLTCAILLGLSTCQRQGEPQQATWNSPARHYPSNLVYQSRTGPKDNNEPALRLPQQQQPQQQQQSESAEYYDDDEYYDDGAEVADEPTKGVVGDQESGAREPKIAKTEGTASRDAGIGNGTLEEDSYYYDDDYEEEAVSEEAAVAPQQQQAVKGEETETGGQVEEQPQQQQQQEKQKQLLEEDKPTSNDQSVRVNEEEEAEAPINRTSLVRNEDVIAAVAEVGREPSLPISPETSSTPSSSSSTSTLAPSSEEKVEPEKSSSSSSSRNDDDRPAEGSILIGEAIVSVVTTKSVINGTYSVPETTTSPPPTPTMSEESVEETISSSSTETASTTDSTSTPSSSSTTTTTTTTTSTTEFTPSSTIQASVQTGRSVSGARFLPFPSVDKVEQLDSTESIIDKLDRVQSELSSGFLANGRFVPRRYNKKPFSATSLTLPPTSTVAPTSSPIAPITISSITKRPKVQTTLDDIAAFLPKDFSKSSYRTSTTSSPPLTKRPKLQTTLDDVEAFLPKDFPKGGSYRTSTPGSTKRPKLQTTLDDLEGFLPKDYPKSGYRGSYKRPSYKTSTTVSSSTTTTTTTTSATKVVSSTERSTASTSHKALTTIEDISAFLPPGYKLKKEDASTEKSLVLSEILSKTKLNGSKDDSTASTTERVKSIHDLFAKSAVDISALLPPGYKPEANSPKLSTTKPSGDPIEELLTKSSVDISALLPSGFKPDASKPTKSGKSGDPVQDLLSKSKVDISALLPPGFNDADKTGKLGGIEAATTEQPALSTAKSSGGSGSSFKVVFPSRPGGRKPIHKITTPPSNASNRSGGAAESATPRIQKGWPIRATTEFTGWPTSSTTPISIEKLLEAARTATVSSVNVSLVPTISETTSTSSTTTTTTTTLRPTTPGVCDEECEVAGTIKIVENATWVPELLDRNTREWQDLAEEIEREMNLVFAKSPVLRKWFRNIRIDSFSQGSVLVDYFIELADLKENINTQQLKVIFHDSLRTYNFDNPTEVKPKGSVKLGKFTIDPKSTDFVVIPRVAAPKMSEDENRLIPQWAIAVIVIGVGGLLFIIVFGVSVLVNRQHGSKLKPSITAMYEEEVSKNVMSHAAPPSRPPSEYQKNDSQTMWNDAGWHDKPFESTSHKILVDGLPYERKYNMYDSWKSEWNGYYYPPTQASGSNFSRHHPDYDINF